MLVLLTGASHPLAYAVAATLVKEGDSVRAADRVPAKGAVGNDFHLGELTDPAFVTPLLKGVDAIVHLAPLSLVEAMPTDAPGEILDAATRGTHVLLKAAVEGTRPVVVAGSTLAVLDAYGDELEVTEQWRPRPRPHPVHLAPYLAELVAREFTRDAQLDSPLHVACLRFAPFGEGPHDLALETAAVAVVRAVSILREGARQRGHCWHLYHVASPSPEARYPSTLAQRALNYATATTRPGHQ